ncbi:MAG: hypothetical protein IT320_15725 [Anaerolineae bacterium]|nr:hypothetical protein [Anaerolineae bacterium]
MAERPLLPRKLRLHAGERAVVFARGINESSEHVLMKALLWALYLPQYPQLSVEIRIGDRYKPDVVQLDAEGRPVFWGEAGQVGEAKIRALVKRYRETHFAIAKWNRSLQPYTQIVRAALDGVQRSAPFDLIAFPADSARRFVDADGVVRVTWDEIEHTHLRP